MLCDYWASDSRETFVVPPGYEECPAYTTSNPFLWDYILIPASRSLLLNYEIIILFQFLLTRFQFQFSLLLSFVQFPFLITLFRFSFRLSLNQFPFSIPQFQSSLSLFQSSLSLFQSSLSLSLIQFPFSFTQFQSSLSLSLITHSMPISIIIIINYYYVNRDPNFDPNFQFHTHTNKRQLSYTPTHTHPCTIMSVTPPGGLGSNPSRHQPHTHRPKHIILKTHQLNS